MTACRECTAPARSLFCSTACRSQWNNRRAMRGAELYDLFRALRRERDKAKEINLWTRMCRLEEHWQREDDAQRPGRRSYVPPVEAAGRLTDAGKICRRLTPAQIDAYSDKRRRVNARKQKEMVG